MSRSPRDWDRLYPKVYTGGVSRGTPTVERAGATVAIETKSPGNSKFKVSEASECPTGAQASVIL